MLELPNRRTPQGPNGLIPRAITTIVAEALSESRGVAVIGPRRSGKTTLVRDLLRFDGPTTYLTLDEDLTRNAAETDPTGLVSRMQGLTIIDEIQRVPDLLLSLKARMDRDRRPAQFIITGSANVQTLPTVRDALPGRLDYVHLWPLAQSEMERHTGNLVEAMFAGTPPGSGDESDRNDIAERIAVGGFADVLSRSPRSRTRFFDSYVDSVVGRDVPDVARTRDPTRVGRLLRLLASRSASIVSLEGLAPRLEVDRKTVERYLRILEDLMLVRLHAAWHTNLASREIRRPKAYVTDTGLLTALVGADSERVANDPTVTGMAFETFVVLELLKLASWSEPSPRLFHYRDRDGREVDAVLERADGSIVAVEIKAASTVKASDFRSLRYLRDKVGPRFRCGVVLYVGTDTFPFGDRHFAVPISSLWS